MKTVGMKTKRESVTDSAPVIEERIVKPNGETIIRKYTKGKLLGKGGFAKCYEVINNETKKVSAAKIVAKASLTKNRAKQKLMSEIKIHRSLHHPTVVSFEQFFEDSENVYILLELCANQTLNELVRRRRKLTELEAKCYIMQLIEGLKYLHSHRVIHRDLKLGNLFLTEKMELKIGDFGLATKLEFDGERKRTICGTPNYIAPEILEGHHGHSYEVDIWSLGVILYTLLIGKPPFETQDVKTTYKRIQMNVYTFPEGTGISEHAKSLIQRILSSDPAKRPKFEEILSHPFLSSTKIPAILPASTLACPPSVTYIRQFTGAEDHKAPTTQIRLESTVPYKENLDLKHGGKEKLALLNTERAILSHYDSKNAAIPLASARVHVATTQPTLPDKKYPAVLNERADNALKQSVNTASVIKHISGVDPVIDSGSHSSKLSTAKRPESGPTSIKEPDVWIKKWVDYSSKYGLGYLLSNGASGVFFNDSTKIILDPHGHYFDYIEKRGSDKQDVAIPYTLTEYPKSLQKKVTLLQHFRSYLEAEGVKPVCEAEGAGKRKLESAIYVKKWLKTKHAIMFRLSNKIVQVNFQDGTEIILSSESKVVTYVNKKGERQSYPLSSALESTNAEMAKRLKYTKEILTRMLNQNAAPKPEPHPVSNPYTGLAAQV